jgi:hypothetical protein
MKFNLIGVQRCRPVVLRTLESSCKSVQFYYRLPRTELKNLGLFAKFRARRWRTLCVRQAYSKNTPAGSTWTSMIKSASSAVGWASSYRRQRRLRSAQYSTQTSRSGS